MNTEILVVADESGSMHALAQDANGSFAKFIEEQKTVPGDCRVTLVKFSNKPRLAYESEPLSQVPALNLAPSNNTALYDAIGFTLTTQGRRIHDQKWAELVILVIITDGQENASIEYSLDQIKTMIKHAESTGWQVIYLASNQDAFEAARNIGSMSNRTMSHAATAQGTQDSYSYASVETRSLRAGPPPQLPGRMPSRATPLDPFDVDDQISGQS